MVNKVNAAEKELIRILNEEERTFVSERKDLTILKYSLDNIKEVCSRYKECSLCPLGDCNNDCLLSTTPKNWMIPEEPIIKVFK